MNDSYKIVFLPLHWPEGGLVNSEKGDTFGKEMFCYGYDCSHLRAANHSVSRQSLQKGNSRDLNKSGLLRLIRILLRVRGDR